MARRKEEEAESLSREEWEAIGAYAHGQCQTALSEPTTQNLRECVEHFSDIFHPDSQLDVDVENEMVEISGWDTNDDEEEEAA
jgi:hypothetical protein